jgi:hypothetical protein
LWPNFGHYLGTFLWTEENHKKLQSGESVAESDDECMQNSGVETYFEDELVVVVVWGGEKITWRWV